MKIIELSPMFEKQIEELYKRRRLLSKLNYKTYEPTSISGTWPLDCDYYSAAFVEVLDKVYYVRFSVNEQNLGSIVHFCVWDINRRYFQGSVDLEKVSEEDAPKYVFNYVDIKIRHRITWRNE